MKKVYLMIALNLFLFVAIFTYVNHNYINKNNIDELLNIALKNDKLLLEKKYTNTINQLHTDSFLTFVDSNKALSFSDNKKTTFLYVGRNNCEFCQEFLPKLANTIKNKNKSINYLDSRLEKERKKEQYYELIEKYGIKGVPTLLKFSNGKVEEYGIKEIDLNVFLN